LGYKIVELPFPPRETLDNFANLPEDPFYKERWRQFSQYIFFFEYDKWTCRVLTHRPFIQAKAFNNKVGGVPRPFEPITNADPLPQLTALAESLKLDKDEVFQINLHQWRTRVGNGFKGAVVPEGPHRDGHYITIVAVWERNNVEGGESTLYNHGKTEPFFQHVLQPGESLVVRDEDMIHGAFDLKASTLDGGFRDIWVIAINPWSERRYGKDFEEYAMALGHN
jgi:hypothetical protein